LPTTASLTRPARSLSKAEAMYIEFLVPKALLSGFSYLRCHKVLARPVSSSHLATLSQSSLLTSTITAKRERGGICAYTRGARRFVGELKGFLARIFGKDILCGGSKSSSEELKASPRTTVTSWTTGEHDL